MVITPDTTASEIHEAIAHLASLPACEVRERRINGLLDELLERRVSATQ